MVARLRTHRRALVATAAAALTCAALLAATSDASAKAFVPERNQLYHGVSDTAAIRDFARFRKHVGEHPAVLQEMYHWDVSLKASGAFRRWNKTRTLGVVSMSTKLPATGRPEISPERIARGFGDHYLLRLNESIANRGKPVLFRLFPEMNGHWNPYSAFNADGSRRDSAHRTKNFRAAWRRFVMIVRGGELASVNKRLRQRGMPRVLRAGSNRAPVYRREGVGRRLPKPKVGFMWVPQTTGSPNVPGNQPKNYWPGGRYVDWVGIDIFSSYASAALPKMRQFYKRWDNKPFMIGEYSPWAADPAGRFTNTLLSWAEKHKRVRMLIYYRSVTADNEHNIQHFPAAKRRMRRHLNKPRWDPFAPRKQIARRR